jgi:hypothetical protein
LDVVEDLAFGGGGIALDAGGDHFLPSWCHAAVVIEEGEGGGKLIVREKAKLVMDLGSAVEEGCKEEAVEDQGADSRDGDNRGGPFSF